jgi:tRNA threonylcarbamoyladenosine biosynthesis protein TsaB
MRILGIDTATWRASVGLLIDGEVVAEQSQVANGSHAVTVLPLLADTLRRAGCTVRDLDAIAVSNGPGAFTGLRIGLSVTKGLACATGVPVVAVPTLEALARTLTHHQGVIWTILDARKGELYAACFESQSGMVHRLTPDAVVTAAELVRHITVPCVVVGDALPRYAAFLEEHLGDRATLLPYEIYGPRGGVVAAMGWERLQAGASEPAACIEPFYVRPSDAERNFGPERICGREARRDSTLS